MKYAKLAAVLLLLFAGITGAQVYRWVDKAGNVHYGDQPPAGSEPQSIAVPKTPPLEQAPSEVPPAAGPPGKQPGEAAPADTPDPAQQDRTIAEDTPGCHTPLSRQVRGPSAAASTPITPSSLNRLQQKTLKQLFAGLDTLWYGSITDVVCRKAPAEPVVSEFEVSASVGVWDAQQLRLTLETDSTGKESGVVKRLVYKFEVGDALFFTDLDSASVALDGNRVELISMGQNTVAFLGKRHISTGRTTRKIRAEVRSLEISGRNVKLSELYYYNGRLTGSRNWILHR